MKWRVEGLRWMSGGNTRYGYADGPFWDRRKPLFTIHVWGFFGRGRRTYELCVVNGLEHVKGVEFLDINKTKYVAEYLHIINEGLDGEG